MTTACGSCAYYDHEHMNAGKSAKDAGVCRYNPPVTQPGPDAHGLWPVVGKQDWCGHFSSEKTAKH